MNKCFAILFYFSLTQMCLSQKQLGGQITAVSKSGIYQLVLPSQMVSVTADRFPNVKILDKSSHEVPYEFVEDFSNETVSFQDFKIIQRSSILNVKSVLILENPQESIDFLTLFVASYHQPKTLLISGSNDKKNWYGVLPPTVIEDFGGSEIETRAEITFVKNNYKFLKIETIDKNSLPLNILRVGQSTTTFADRKWQSVAVKTFKQNASKLKKSTIVAVAFNDYQKIEKLKFLIDQPKQYSRNIRCFELVTSRVIGKSVQTQSDFASFVLQPSAILEFPSKRVKHFFIEIENNDSPPLMVTAVQCFQQPAVVIASLQANETYTIKTQNEDVARPIYDLSEFKNININNLPQVAIKNLTVIDYSLKSDQSKNFWNSKLFLWISIGLAGVAILFFVVLLLKDLNKNVG